MRTSAARNRLEALPPKTDIIGQSESRARLCVHPAETMRATAAVRARRQSEFHLPPATGASVGNTSLRGRLVFVLIGFLTP